MPLSIARHSAVPPVPHPRPPHAFPLGGKIAVGTLPIGAALTLIGAVLVAEAGTTIAVAFFGSMLTGNST